MQKLSDILHQPEGRRLEFKAQLPTSAELAKSIIAFANDAGGEFYLGIQDKPREVTGLEEDSLIGLEEKISSIIHDQCAPVILPEMLFLNHEGKHIILTKIHKVSAPRVAEMVKILENTYRLVNIILINELALLAGKMDILAC